VAGKTAILTVDILADASKATAGFDAAGAAASSTADKISDVGDKSGTTATGLSALSGALDAAGFGPAADALGLVATGLDAAEGSTMLFKVAQESLSLTTIKDTAARIANSVATKAASAATKAWAAVQWLLNAAMSANPIGLIIGLVVGLIAVIVLIATKTTWFQTAWEVAWRAIKTAAAAVWDWLKGAGETALEGLLWPIKQVQKAFDTVVDAIESVIKWLGKIKLPDALSKAGELIGKLPGFNSTSSSTGSSAPGVSSQAMGRASGGGTTTVQVFVPESSDPVATARYLKALIRRGEAAGVIFGTV
jgi:hypothetical protein